MHQNFKAWGLQGKSRKIKFKISLLKKSGQINQKFKIPEVHKYNRNNQYDNGFQLSTKKFSSEYVLSDCHLFLLIGKKFKNNVEKRTSYFRTLLIRIVLNVS